MDTDWYLLLSTDLEKLIILDLLITLKFIFVTHLLNTVLVL